MYIRNQLFAMDHFEKAEHGRSNSLNILGMENMCKKLNSTTPLKKTVLEYLPPPPLVQKSFSRMCARILNDLPILNISAVPCERNEYAISKRDIGRWLLERSSRVLDSKI